LNFYRDTVKIRFEDKDEGPDDGTSISLDSDSSEETKKDQRVNTPSSPSGMLLICSKFGEL
jgi:hypothetical protein